MFNVEAVRLAGSDIELPRMIPIEQRFAATAVEDLEGTIRSQVTEHDSTNPVSGKRIAITAGSRGIAQLDRIVATLVDALVSCGAKPFVVPAMGSHGGGTADGQRQVLAEYGITEESIGAPIVSSMETVVVTELPDGTPVHFDAEAARADGVVVLGRVKPHTDFRGTHESGLAKMIAIGLGKHRGAAALHRHGFEAFHSLIPAVAEAALQVVPIEFGMAVVENAYERVARLELVQPGELLEREAELLVAAKQLMPKLLMSDIDVLVVDEIGKDISGAGMDPNITGRSPVSPEQFRAVPIKRVVVLGLTEHTNGNACGLGLADVTTQRCVDQIEFGSFYTNSLTSGVPDGARIPMALADDRDAITAALHMSRGPHDRPAKVVRIRNTLSMPHVEVSEAYAQEVADHPDLTALGEPHDWDFDTTGTLRPLP
ncbi:lactate racemase domain-containing protein [Saccharopolyspora sp. WRP15-2]|uniref:Lactate racemase domain-containing protein n=1 Tax=Saccharopolyspora oryzae TaxID=2997343 RepID=A0ABT4V9C5_9PSEU|nr:lactate racemase domain-containing protein [Saccharopolyspora oryzae]MDA3630570.1 lactate racemase domain-containing protein [Saccharopolyspora oryzae]